MITVPHYLQETDFRTPLRYQTPRSSSPLYKMIQCLHIIQARLPTLNLFWAVLSRSVTYDSLQPYMDCSPPGSSVLQIFQERILE